ncbi:hypothetical protein AB1Y20_013482 [Prymnesium parvum]|uniref:G-protein coupled receptors family 3 profile domain-containing protein n=1 Tax=Prymnesium parvum TaxID=97485 RepID=A0AB34IIU2_PRYPA
MSRVALLLSLAAGGESANVTIGFIHRISSRGTPIPFWQRVTCAGLMAIKHANERDGSIVAEFASLRKTYAALSTDSQSVEAGTVAAYQTCKAGHVKGIVGPARSATNLQAGYLGGYDGLVNIGTWTSSPVLSDATTFPYLARVYHSDTVRAARVVETLQYFNWTRFAIIHVDDAWANQIVKLVRGLVRNAEGNGGVDSRPIVMNTFSFEYDNEESVRLAVQRLSQMIQPVYIFVAIVFDVDSENMCDEADKLGLLTPQHVWIDPDGISTTPLETAVNKQTFGERLHGWLRVTTIFPQPYFSRYQARWPTMTSAACTNPYFTANASWFQHKEPDLGAYEYDAAAAMVLALDSLTEAEENDGDAVRAAVGALDFSGASGRIRFYSNLDRDLATAEMALMNMVFHPDREEVEFRVVRIFRKSDAVISEVANEDISNITFDIIFVAPIVWLRNSSVQPVDLTTVIPYHDELFLRSALTAVCIALAAVSGALALLCIGWTYLHRDHPVVKSAQPPFLMLIAGGVFVTLLAVYPLSLDHRDVTPDENGRYPSLDGACASAMWFYLLGFDITYGSLWAKLWRVKKIFLDRKIGQGPVTTQRMFVYVLSPMLLDILLMVLLHVDSPFVYVVSILERDEYGRPTQSYGQCTADERVWTYIALLIAFHGMLLLVANSLVYQLRHVPSEYNEGKYVGISLANNLQTSLVALMLLFLVTDNPQVIFSVKFFEVYWSATLTLLMMFLPKILIVHINDESDLTAASEVMREAKKGRAEQPKTMKSTFESIFTLRSSFNASARPSVVPHAGDLNIPATKVEQAQAIARELMTCVNRQATVSEWLSTAALKVETMSNDAEMSEKADTVAHLIVQGEHLRFLLKKAARRGA